MKLGEGGEAFFVFETSAAVPEALQTSPLVSPVTSPTARPATPSSVQPVPDLEPLDFDGTSRKLHPPQLATSLGTSDTLATAPGRLRAESGW